MAQWLIDAGHRGAVLTTARFASPVTFTLEAHLDALGVDVQRRKPARKGGRPVLHYTLGDVPVRLLQTRHNEEARPDREEGAQFVALFDDLLRETGAELVIACNGH